MPGSDFQVLANREARRFGANAAVFSVKPDGSRLVFAAYSRLAGPCPNWEQALGDEYQRGENLPGRVWETRAGILIPEVDGAALCAVAPPKSRAISRPVRTLMMVPLVERGEVFGVLALTRDEEPAFTERDYEALRARTEAMERGG